MKHRTHYSSTSDIFLAVLCDAFSLSFFGLPFVHFFPCPYANIDSLYATIRADKGPLLMSNGVLEALSVLSLVRDSARMSCSLRQRSIRCSD